MCSKKILWEKSYITLSSVRTGMREHMLPRGAEQTSAYRLSIPTSETIRLRLQDRHGSMSHRKG
jgi:hypothetical protein